MINCYFKTCNQEGRSSGRGTNTEAEHQWDNVLGFFLHLLNRTGGKTLHQNMWKSVSMHVWYFSHFLLCVTPLQSVQRSLYSPRVCSTIVSSATSSCACCWNAWNRSSREELKTTLDNHKQIHFYKRTHKTKIQSVDRNVNGASLLALYIRDVTKLEFQTRYHFQCHGKVSTPCCNNRSNGAEFISAAAVYIPSSSDLKPIWFLLCSGFHSLFARISSPHAELYSVQLQIAC